MSLEGVDGNNKAEGSEAFRNLVHQLAENTAMHGLPNATKAKTKERKLFWIAVLIFGMGKFKFHGDITKTFCWLGRVTLVVHLRFSPNTRNVLETRNKERRLGRRRLLAAAIFSWLFEVRHYQKAQKWSWALCEMRQRFGFNH